VATWYGYSYLQIPPPSSLIVIEIKMLLDDIAAKETAVKIPHTILP
jgi:hypothetical protein